MASFTETAVLIVKDSSTPQIRKINAELKKLAATARSLKSIKIDISASSKLSKALSDIKKLTSEVKALKSAAASIKLNVNASGIAAAQRQINQLRQSAAKPINVTTRNAAAAGQPPRQPGSTGSQHGYIRQVADQIGRQIVSAAGRATREGTKTIDVGETSLALKELSKERRQIADQNIRDIAKEQAARPGGAMFNRGQVQQQYSEMLGVVKIGAATSEEDARKRQSIAKFLADQNLELAATYVKLGMDQERATLESIKYGKALELSGKLYDTEGNLRRDVAAQEYNNIRRLIPSLGAEATGSNYLAMMKHLRTAKYALEPEAMASAMAKFEDMGVGAANAINQVIRQLGGGRTTKAALNEQARLGLIGLEEKTTGSVGKQKTRTIAGKMSEENSKLLRESPQRYIDTKMIPALKRDLMERQKLTEAQAEAKLNDPAWVGAKMDKLFGSSTASDMATSMILLRKENAQFLADWRSRTGSAERQRDDTKLSIVGATAAITAQSQGLFGEMARAVAPVLVPTLGVMSEAVRQFGDTVATAQGTGPEAKAAQSKIEGGILATVLAAPFVKMGLGVGKGLAKPVIDAIDLVAKPIGMISAIEGMTSSNPAVRSLSSAGWLLQTAASDLSAAAGKQNSWWDMIRDAAGEVFRKGAPALTAANAVRFGGAATGGALAVGIAYALNRIVGAARDNPDAWMQSVIAQHRLELEAARRARATAKPEEWAGLDATIKGLTEQIAKMSSNLAHIQGETKPDWLDPKTLAPPPQTETPDWGDPKAIAAAVAAQLKKSETPGWGDPSRIAAVSEAAMEAHLKSLMRAAKRRPIRTRWDESIEAQRANERATREASKSTPVPKKERKTFGKGAAPIPFLDESKAVPDWLKDYQKAITQTPTWVAPVTETIQETPVWVPTIKEALKETPSWVATFKEAPTWLQTYTQATQATPPWTASITETPSKFGEVFATGTTAIANSGVSAANSIVNAMPGAGAALGNAAAAVIRAAVADININAHVNVDGGDRKPNTGSQNPP